MPNSQSDCTNQPKEVLCQQRQEVDRQPHTGKPATRQLSMVDSGDADLEAYPLPGASPALQKFLQRKYPNDPHAQVEAFQCIASLMAQGKLNQAGGQ